MIDNILNKKSSIRDFDKSELDDGTILSLFEAARKAPSAFNEQPWRFILADRKNINDFDLILGTLTDKNRAWAVNASILVIVLAKTNLTRNDNPNKHYLYDTASAVANLTFKARSLDIHVHQMGGFDSEKVKNNFSVSNQFEPAVVLAIGKKSELYLEPVEQPLELNRKSLNEILFGNKFAEPHSILSEENQLII